MLDRLHNLQESLRSKQDRIQRRIVAVTANLAEEQKIRGGLQELHNPVLREIESEHKVQQLERAHDDLRGLVCDLNSAVSAGFDENKKDCVVMVTEATQGLETSVNERLSALSGTLRGDVKRVTAEVHRRNEDACDKLERCQLHFAAEQRKQLEEALLETQENLETRDDGIRQAMHKLHQDIARMQELRMEDEHRLSDWRAEVLSRVDDQSKIIAAQRAAVTQVADTHERLERRLAQTDIRVGKQLQMLTESEKRLHKKVGCMQTSSEVLESKMGHLQSVHHSSISQIASTLTGIEKDLSTKSFENRFLVRRGGGYSYRCLLESGRKPMASAPSIPEPSLSFASTKSTRSPGNMLKRLQKIGRFPTVDDEGRLVMTNAEQIVRIE